MQLQHLKDVELLVEHPWISMSAICQCWPRFPWAHSDRFNLGTTQNANCFHFLHWFWIQKWMFPKIRVPQNGWFIMKHPLLKWMIWGENPLFLETSIWIVDWIAAGPPWGNWRSGLPGLHSPCGISVRVQQLKRWNTTCNDVGYG